MFGLAVEDPKTKKEKQDAHNEALRIASFHMQPYVEIYEDDLATLAEEVYDDYGDFDLEDEVEEWFD